MAFPRNAQHSHAPHHRKRQPEQARLSLSNFVIQGSDPTGKGWAGADFVLPDEVSDRPYRRGSVSMATAGKDTAPCHLFITLAPTPHLEGGYTQLGTVTEGLSVVDQIEVGDRILSAQVP